MSFRTEHVGGHFVGDFKVGDNLVFNARLLCELVEANDEGRFNKLIVLQVGAILEAALSEIIYRAQNNNREGVPGMSEAYRKEIEGKKIDKFNAIIDVMRKYEVLHEMGPGIYEDLHKLRKHRNKVHIQEDLQGESRDESEVFVGTLCDWSLNLNLRVLRFLSEHRRRPDKIRNYVADIEVPIPSSAP